MNGDSSTVLRYKFHRRGVMNVPCPKCGGKLVLGMVFREDEIRCTQCEEKWSSENAPGNFSENTYFWNVTIDGDSQPEEPAPLHPVDAAIITDSDPLVIDHPLIGQRFLEVPRFVFHDEAVWIFRS